MAGEPIETTLQAYPAYKDSGVPWIGEIPEGWEAQPVRRGFNVIGGTTPESGNESFWDGDQLWATPEDISKIEGKTLSDTRRKITHAAVDQTTLTEVQRGVILLTTRAPIGNLALTAEPMTFNQGCKALIPRAHLEADFSYYAIKAATPILQAFGKGTTFMELSAGALKAFSVPVPPLPDQQAIATFLDRETARIDELLLEQEGLLNDLEQKRRSACIYTVTQGLQADRQIRDAGVPWLDRIPETWGAEPLKNLVRIQGGHTPRDEPHFWNGDVPWVSPKDMKTPVIEGSEDKVTEAATHEGNLNLYPPGAVLMVVRSGILRNKVPVAVNAVPVTVNQDMKVLRPTDRLMPKFLYYFFEGLGPTLLPVIQKVGATVESINMAALRGLIVPVPPLAEQQAITDHLDRVLSQLDQLVSEVRASMELMRQHRSALITAAVTGKIDVREAHVPSPVGAE